MVEVMNLGLEFRGKLRKRDLKTIDMIILHHSASPRDSTTIHSIHRWHLQRGWLGIGYHYVIHSDGSVFEGRPIDAVGAHARGYNKRSIGVCVVGNFEEERPTLQQQEAVGKLILYLQNKLGRLTIKKHNQVTATKCPGRNFMFLTPKEVKSRVNIEEIERLIHESIHNLQQIKDILRRS